jgi:hypothetical protein
MAPRSCPSHRPRIAVRCAGTRRHRAAARPYGTCEPRDTATRPRRGAEPHTRAGASRSDKRTCQRGGARSCRRGSPRYREECCCPGHDGGTCARPLRTGRRRGVGCHASSVLQSEHPRGARTQHWGVRGRVARLPVAVGRRRFRRKDPGWQRRRRTGCVWEQAAVLQRGCKGVHDALPEGRRGEGEEGLGVHGADHRRHGARISRAIPKMPASRVPGAVVPDLAVVRMPLPRLQVQPRRREARWAGTAGHGSFPLTISGGTITVDTSIIVLGPPIGTNTTGQAPEGAPCV